MRNKSNERLEGGRIHVRNISFDEKYPPLDGRGGCERSVANDREKEREVPGRKKGRRTPDENSFCNFAWTSPLISTRQIHRAWWNYMAWLTPFRNRSPHTAVLRSILPSLRKNRFQEQFSCTAMLARNRKQFLVLASVKRGLEWKSGWTEFPGKTEGNRTVVDVGGAKCMGVSLRNIVRETAPSQLSLPGYLSSACISWNGPFYPRQLTPPNPPSPPPFDLREDLHYKYVPTGMHVRQYDGSLFPFLSPILLLSVPPILTSSLCLSILLRYRE